MKPQDANLEPSSPAATQSKPSISEINSKAVDVLLETLKASIAHLEAARAQLEADPEPEDPVDPSSEDSSENLALHLRRLVARHELWEAWLAAGHVIQHSREDHPDRTWNKPKQPKSLSTVDWHDLRKLSIQKNLILRLTIDDLQEAFKTEMRKTGQQEFAKYAQAVDTALDGLFSKYELWLDAMNKTVGLVYVAGSPADMQEFRRKQRAAYGSAL
ncbi:hypothetical protein FRB90_003811 [Tulasnella sp. 427]|nr:hypothetical protein FRB90_003811 [Tulasnella sp. 427]